MPIYFCLTIVPIVESLKATPSASVMVMYSVYSFKTLVADPRFARGCCRGRVSSPHFFDLPFTLVQKRRTPDAIYQDSLHNWMTLTIAIATFYNGWCFHSFYDVSVCRLKALSFLNRFFRFSNWICCTNLSAILSVFLTILSVPVKKKKKMKKMSLDSEQWTSENLFTYL